MREVNSKEVLPKSEVSAMVKKMAKLEEAKSLVKKKVQALDALETLISGINKNDLNQFFSSVSFLGNL